MTSSAFPPKKLTALIKDFLPSGSIRRKCVFKIQLTYNPLYFPDNAKKYTENITLYL